ncbi:hypothetical protein [Mucilaginibacter gotjawali]|uniref:Uncharacterized protein n=2 Tax=Mucilaginibacter gotjawali TaxID=1550579 RepID=A0A839SGG4_9SPHI|nr:hypothetical protein [Mucilaginibacter gotjawali]MBB3057381.1 hypothetical protein [Mucilaginibacter gotjawali]BAU55500.1 hypothetical protein MgSA37_03689 [Mucilaginibacter gotjawali]
MVKPKTYRILGVVFFGLFNIYNLYAFLYVPYKSDQDILKVSYGIKSNPLRKKLNIPVIEGDMSPIYRYHQFYASNRWESGNEYPVNGVIAHPYKFVDADRKTLRLKEEGDSYRRRINDTIFQQINIDSEIIGDTISKRHGLLFYMHKSNLLLDTFVLVKPYNKELKLDERGVDSVAKKWHLDYLVKEK